MLAVPAARCAAYIYSMEQQTEQHPPLNYHLRKRKVILAAAILSLLLGPPTILYENTLQPHVIDIVSHIGFAMLMFAWCFYDSLERNKSLSSAFRFLIVIFGAFALLAYLLKSRGLRKGLRAIGAALLLLLGMSSLLALSGGLFEMIRGF